MEKLKMKYFSVEKLYHVNKFMEIKSIMDNYQTLFLEIFPKSQLMVLNHNDVHRLNIMKGIFCDDIKILDHEYAALNLIGIDIVNFMIESTFDYTLKSYPNYTFNQEGIDFTHFYNMFLKFIEKFEESHSDNIDMPNELFQKKMAKIKTYKYFLKLVCVISLFWLLYSVIYLDINKIVAQDSFDSFHHALDRITIFQLAFKQLRNLKDTSHLENYSSASSLKIAELNLNDF